MKYKLVMCAMVAAVLMAIGPSPRAANPLAPPAAPAEPAPADHASADVTMLAKWIVGEGDAKGPLGRFPESDSIAIAKDAIVYTDVDAVHLPKQLRRVPYDFIQARLHEIGGSGRFGPAVVITRSVAEEPDDSLRRKAQQKKTDIMSKTCAAPPIKRYYYVHVAIGNLDATYFKLAVYEANGTPKVDFLWRAES